MFFPKNQIITNLHTNGGELIYLRNNSPYKGFYFKTSDGRYFTGRDTEDKPNERLIEIRNFNSNISDIKEIIKDNPITVWTLDIGNYPKPLSGFDNFPKNYYPKPTPENYEEGFIERYFLKKVNESTFIEINLNEYNKYISRNNTVPYPLFIPANLTWKINGNINDVVKFNQEELINAENEFNVKGIYKYLKNRLNEFYKII